MRFAKRAAATICVAALMAASFAAGAASNETVAKLNQTTDLLTKAKAVLGATTSNRAGYGNVEKAKAAVDTALAETQKAVVANGG